ncbi:hypothetical protein [[Kitasatospora] papulosa]|uniref:hypothetical protein n=1 Tax=[Kitasatospora] papulosa TaxID=1464011 RepID=UPI0036C771DC
MTTQPEQDRLHHLLDRLRRGVILPAEAEQLAGHVGELEQQLKDQAATDQVASRASQVITAMGADIRVARAERDRYWTAWQSARIRVTDARAEVTRLIAAPEVDRRSLHAQHVAALTDAYPDLRHTADHIANLILGVRDEHVRELEQRVAELTAGQCTHQPTP